MRLGRSGWRGAAVGAGAAAGAVLAGLIGTGCQAQVAGHQPATVESCIQFGITAIRQHADVVSVPAACRGLTRAQVNFAVGSALHAMADTVRGKARQRERAIRLSPLLADLVTTVPAQPGPPPVTAPAGRPAGPPAPLGLIALASWLVTAGLGAWMTARWILRGGLRRSRPGAAGLPPPLILGHFGLAVAGLLAWIIYLATGLAGVGWAACAILLPVTGLGMALVSLGPAEPPGPAPERVTARPVPVTAGPVPAVPRSAAVTTTPAGPGPSPAQAGPGQRKTGPPPALIVAAHGVLAVATILFALLAVIGSG